MIMPETSHERTKSASPPGNDNSAKPLRQEDQAMTSSRATPPLSPPKLPPPRKVISLNPKVAAAIKKDGHEVLSILGKGAYSTVYLTEYTPADKEDNSKSAGKTILNAVKVISFEGLSDRYKTKFLPRELQILQNVKHPNIVQVYQIIEVLNISTIIFMEYAARGTVAKLIRSGPLSELATKPIMIGIINALLYMHSNKIAHRDLKLENILMDQFGNPKVSDFSFAVMCNEPDNSAYMSRTYVGTIDYLPPELLQELPYDPMVADIWSLGICHFILLNATEPFSRDISTRRRIQDQVQRNWTFREAVEEKLSKQVVDFVRKMLEPDPKKRITTTGLKLHAWLKKKA